MDELIIIKIANKMDMSYDFYIRHNMHAVECKLFAMNNKDEAILNKLNPNWIHPLIQRFSHVTINNK